MNTRNEPTVTILIPTFRESAAIDRCLAAVSAQTYPRIIETLVVDGRSDDDTRPRASAHLGVTVLDNPARIQACALNIGIEAAQGDIIVRVDGHCVIREDYVERCVIALGETGAAVVGGAMTPVASGAVQIGIATAMASRFGAGPARFHTGGVAGWVDTVYLGAYRADDARAVGGYATDVGVNEDAEFAIRMAQQGGVWFDPTIQSTYTPRGSLPSVACQFFRYGLSRAATVQRHPRSLKLRQLAAPGLLIGLASPFRCRVLKTYAVLLCIAAATEDRRARGRVLFAYLASLPTMHLAWAVGFLLGLLGLPANAPEVKR